MQKKHLIIASVALYLTASVASFAGFKAAFRSITTSTTNIPSRFSKLISPLVPKAGQGAVTADNAPKTEACPLNGKLYSKAEREAWEKRTPLAVMIENHVDARPQSGLSSSDVVFEAIAEGGITRYMAMVYCDVQTKDVILAPVRSARTYFIDWASSYQEPIYVHVGGANIPGPSNALGQLDDYGWAGANDFNQFSIGFPTFARNYDRITLESGETLATEHTMETSSERLWKYAAENREITTWAGASKFKAWEFKDDAEEKSNTAVIGYDFWDDFKQFHVDWNFDASSNAYNRSIGGQADKDLNNGQQIAARNVVVLFTTEKGPINENKHMLYGTVGSGKALIFQDGKVVQAQWQKTARTAPLNFTVSGKPVKFNRGLTWISIVANDTKIEY